MLVILVGGTIPVLGSVTSPSQSVSQLWASSRQKHLATSILLTIFGAGFCGWLAAWLIPNYQLWPGMYVVVALAYVATLGVAWFPLSDKPGEHSLRHPHFIGGATVTYGVVMGYIVILLAHGKIPPVSHGLAIAALVYSAAWPTFFLRGIRNYFIVLEILLVLLFSAVMIALTLGV